jgi:hypothetical protein
MKKDTKIYESLVILLFILFFCQLYVSKGADFDKSHFVEKINYSDYLIKYQINHPELPIGPVEGNCLKCRFIPANPIIFLELLLNAPLAKTDHWFRKELSFKQLIWMVSQYKGYYATTKYG